MGLGEVGLEPDRLAVFGDGLVELPLVAQGVAEVVVGLGEVGLEPDRLAAFGDGLVELPLVIQGDAEVGVGPASSGLSRIASRQAATACSSTAAASFDRPRSFNSRPETAQVTAVLGPQPGQVPEDLDRLVGFALVGQRMGQLVGRLGADGAGGGVEADRVVAAAEPLQDPGEVIVDPDVPGVADAGPDAAPSRPSPGLPRRPGHCPAGRG